MWMSLLHCISQLESQSLGPPLPVTCRHPAGLVSQMCSDKCLLVALVLSWVIQAQLLRLRLPGWPGLSLSGPTINVRNHPQQQIHLAESRLLIPVALGSYPGGQCLGWTSPPPPGHSCANKWPGKTFNLPLKKMLKFCILNITPRTLYCGFNCKSHLLSFANNMDLDEPFHFFGLQFSHWWKESNSFCHACLTE